MYTIPQRSGDIQAVFDKFRESIFSDLKVATIGIVTAIDAENGLPTVKPIINERIVDNKGQTKWQEYPEIPDTPYIGETPSVGDSVLLIYCDHDISGWVQYAGTGASGAPAPQNQQILRNHNISDAVAITGLRTSGSVVAPINYTEITNASTADNGIGVSEALVKFLESYEGCRLNWYSDNGTPAIGYGHDSSTKTLPNGFTAPLTAETAEALFKYDLTQRYIPSVRSTFSGYKLSQQQFDAMVAFCYNLGSVGNKMANAVKSGMTGDALKKVFEDYSGCTVDGKWTKPYSPLLKRRDAEWAMFCYGKYQV